MNRLLLFVRVFFLPFLLSVGLSRTASASDGFDNNYVGGDANQLGVTINGLNKAVLFGPGLMSTGGFFINIPNGATDNRGQVSSFVISSASSFIRSSYLDRVLSTTLYYRVYPVSGTTPGWSTLNLLPQSVLDPGTCYGQTQSNTWQINQSINVLQGLSNGDYVLEFYIRSELYDVGNEDNICNINATDQCNTSQAHTGRFISSRFNVTDPTACDLANIIANQSNPTIIAFQVINAPLPVELAYFRGKEVDSNVQLQWGSAQEQSLDVYQLERSNDAFHWIPLADIPAAGNSTVSRDYTFIDQEPARGRNYYRLKANSVDGQVDISSVVEVSLKEADLQWSIWPNPVRDMLQISISEPGNEPLALKIFNSSGQLVLDQSSDGGDLSSLHLDRLVDGMYLLELDDLQGHRVGEKRFVKMN